MKSISFLIVACLVVMRAAIAGTSGTGFAIAPTCVLTAYHVVEGGKRLQVRFGEQPWMNASFIDGNKEDDWAVLRLQDAAPAVVAVDSRESPEQGDKVYTFGYPEPDVMGGMDIKFNEGSISALSGYKGDKRLIQHSVPVTHGNSGGALFLSDYDKPIGLIVSGLKAEFAQNANYALSLTYLYPRISKYIDGAAAEAKRRNSRKATCLVVCDGVGGSASGSVNASENDTNTGTYQKCKDMVAVVKGESVDGGYGVGTGFLCEMDGKKYFVTNKHVANQRGKVMALFLDGTRFVFKADSPMDVARNRDLVRFEVQTSRKCLEMANDTPNIGDGVEFYGNANGKSVVTVTAAKVLAVGQENVEIDGKIQAGNSGSPLVRVSDGKVVGVTTFSTFNRLDNDLSKVGTRYDPRNSLTREFAVRFMAVEWASGKYGQFLKSVNARKDLFEFVALMERVCMQSNQVFEYRIQDLKFVGVGMLNDQLKKIAKCDEAGKKARDRVEEMVLRNRTDRTISKYNELEFKAAIKTVKDRTLDSFRVRPKVMESVLQFVRSTRLLSDEDRKVIAEALDLQLRTYNEKFRMQLKGLDLPGVPGRY